MNSSRFDFKQFSIIRTYSAMKLTTDAVLLGAWSVNKVLYKKALDVGTGTGVLSLILAQYNQDAEITAIDIDDGSIVDANLNFSNSRFSSKINLFNMDFRDYQTLDKKCYFDFIICNPPYFNKSLDYHNSAREYARCSDNALTANNLFEGVVFLLSDGGFFSMVIPIDRADEYILSASNNGLSLLQRQNISSIKGYTPYVSLLLFTKISITEHELNMNLFNEYKNTNKTEFLFEDKCEKSFFWKNLTKDLYLR
jgi:tRNA1Val (adenine37-N6)-methyltransferase